MPSAPMNPILSLLRSTGAAVLLLAAVAATAATLYAYWPAGVAVGVVLGTVAVLAVGARMQLTDRLQPTDADLAATLGVATTQRAARAEPAVAQPVVARTAVAEAPAAPPAPAVVEPVVVEPVLHVQPDVLYFTSDEDPDVVEVREVVTATNDIITVPGQEHALVEAAAPLEVVDPVRADLEQLKADLGEDYLDFARAARLVVSTQYASAARLQRDLDLPYSRARRLLSDLEEQHFVGPATGSLPRQVLLSKDRLPEVEALLADA